MLPARNFFRVTLLLHVTLPRDPLHMALVQLNSICEIELIEHLFTILPKDQLLWSAEDPYCQHVIYYVTSSVHAEHPP